MIFAIAILIAFIGGVLGRGLRFRRTRDEWIAFLIPVVLCTGLIHIPAVMDLLTNGTPQVSWKEIKAIAAFQALAVTGAIFLTGTGWACSWFIQAVFEAPDES